MATSLDDCSLAWRWSKLPASARLEIRPLTVEQAAEIHARAERLWGPRGPIARWEVIEFADIPSSIPTEWLKKPVPTTGADVLVSWDQRDGSAGAWFPVRGARGRSVIPAATMSSLCQWTSAGCSSIPTGSSSSSAWLRSNVRCSRQGHFGCALGAPLLFALANDLWR
jgi:hypothetical protein